MRQVLGRRMGHRVAVPCDGLRGRGRACDRWVEQCKLHLDLCLVIPLILQFYNERPWFAIRSSSVVRGGIGALTWNVEAIVKNYPPVKPYRSASDCGCSQREAVTDPFTYSCNENGEL